MIQLKGQKYLVTGGAGFIGSHIAEEIVRQGKQVIVVDDLSAGKQGNLVGWWNSKQCTFVYSDITEWRGFDVVFDAIFHNAASKCSRCLDDPFHDFLTNGWGTYLMAKFALSRGAKLIHASTGSVNNGNPVSYYGVSKLAAEKYLPVIKGYHPDFRYTILRYYHVYGPRQDDSDKGGVIPIFCRNIREGKPIRIFGDGEQVRHFTWVKDVVNANFWAANEEYTDGKAYDVVSDVKVSINGLSRAMAMETVDLIGGNYEPERPGEIRKFYMTNKAILEDGFPGFDNDFHTRLRETMQSYDVKVRRREQRAA